MVAVGSTNQQLHPSAGAENQGVLVLLVLLIRAREKASKSEMTTTTCPSSDAQVIARTLLEVLVSPNEEDRNGEVANVVDGLFAIDRSLNRVVAAIERHDTRGEAARPEGQEGTRDEVAGYVP